MTYANPAIEQTPPAPWVGKARELLGVGRRTFELVEKTARDFDRVGGVRYWKLKGIKCLLCGSTSWGLEDRLYRYCGHCGVFHNDVRGIVRAAAGADPRGWIGVAAASIDAGPRKGF